MYLWAYSKCTNQQNIKEQEDVLMLMNRLKEIGDEQLASNDVQKTVEDTVKYAKRRRKIKKLVDYDMHYSLHKPT